MNNYIILVDAESAYEKYMFDLCKKNGTDN